jgi:hypothetical protein
MPLSLLDELGKLINLGLKGNDLVGGMVRNLALCLALLDKFLVFDLNCIHEQGIGVLNLTGSVAGLDRLDVPGKLIAILIQLLVHDKESGNQGLITHWGSIGLNNVDLGPNLLMECNDIPPASSRSWPNPAMSWLMMSVEVDLVET